MEVEKNVCQRLGDQDSSEHKLEWFSVNKKVVYLFIMNQESLFILESCWLEWLSVNKKVVVYYESMKWKLI